MVGLPGTSVAGVVAPGGALLRGRGRWTVARIPDLAGKVVVVTGANSGIGLEAARRFSIGGADTILACRSEQRGRRALLEIRSEHPHARARLIKLDLGSLTSIERFAREFDACHSRLDVLVNNAGIMAVPYSRTADGFESQMGTNHLGHFALTGRLLKPLVGTPGARVVTVSSNVHRMGQIDFDNLLYEKGGYSAWGAYFRSKLANLLFTYELRRRFEGAGVDTLSLAAHPGSVATNLGAHFFRSRWLRPVRPLVHGLLQDPAMGALPVLRASVDPEARAGQYFGPDGLMGQRGFPVVVASTPASHDSQDAGRLWQASERLTGVRYLGVKTGVTG